MRITDGLPSQLKYPCGPQETDCARAQHPLDCTQHVILALPVDDPEVAPFFCSSHAPPRNISKHDMEVLQKIRMPRTMEVNHSLRYKCRRKIALHGILLHRAG